jgi:glycolate oxidase iron-sulfur subunit
VYHMGDHESSFPHMKGNIDAWHAEIDGEGLDAVVINTSGCGVVVKDYGHIFRDDPGYAAKAARVSAITKDLSEVVHGLELPTHVSSQVPALRVAYHDACSLQHGQQIRAEPRALLGQAGFRVLDIPDPHLCCGSAGTYNLLQPDAAEKLGALKAEAVESVSPQVVAMGNIGCMEQIAAYSQVPVVHTVQLLDWATGGPVPAGLGDLTAT